MSELAAQPAESDREGRRPHVLVADDQADVVRALRLLLRGEGFEVSTAASPRTVLDAVDQSEFDVLLIDLNYTRDTTSGAEGLDLLQAIRRRDTRVPIVVMTAWSTVELAVEALRAGAADFLEKPWKNQRLISILRTQAALGAALRESERLRAERHGRDDETRAPIIAESAAMRRVMRVVEQIAAADVSLLICGDNGTGKGLLARYLHDHSTRRESAFVTVNVGALAAGVFESEMFGHVRGAFTDARTERMGRFEMADGGTLFLDEIGNLPLAQQAKLLQVLETGRFERVGDARSRSVDVRLVAATNADLQRAVAAGSFRKDLYFRVNTVQIEIPPLAERSDDILPLASLFLERYARKYSRTQLELSREAVAALLDYGWPGNVRELDHVIERAVLLAPGEQIRPTDLHLDSGGAGIEVGPGHLMPIAEAEQRLIRAALARFDGNVLEAARALGLSRSALYRRLGKYGLGN